MKVLCGSMVDYPNDSLASCYWSWCEDKWFVLPEQATAATSFASHSFNIWTFLHVSTRQCPGSPCSQNGFTVERPDFIRLRYWPPNSPDSQPGSRPRSGAFCKSKCTVARSVRWPFERTTESEWRRFDQRIIDIAVGQWWQRLRVTSMRN